MTVPNNANTFLPPCPVIPPFLLIANITNSFPMVVTVTTPNSYVVNQTAYFSIPFDYGMFQLNSLMGTITAVDPTNLIFSVNIDSTVFDTFVVPGAFKEQPASMSPAGSMNIYNSSTVPFHSAGNFGN